MIIIPRKRNESVVIGENITLTVIEIRADKVRLGIEFPRDIRVQPGEIYSAAEKVSAEQKPAL